MLYAFADKFLDGKDLEKVKEEISMTKLGHMLMEDGFKKGVKKGEESGKADLLIKMLVKKFKNVPNEYKDKIKKLSKETIDVIGMEIFEMKSIEELREYFKDK